MMLSFVRRHRHARLPPSIRAAGVASCVLGACAAGMPALAQLQGHVEQHAFVGPILGNTVPFNIYLPAGYDTSTARYPVIYFLHGLGGSQGGPSNTTVPLSYESALAAGIIGPVIVVFPSGYEDSMWADSFNGAKPAETDVIRQLIPHVDANFRTLACPSQRVITGFSMGGYGAPEYYAKFPHLFTAAIAYDGSIATWGTFLAIRPDLAANIFGGSEAYFDQYSPWHWSTANANLLASRSDFRMVTAAQVNSNRMFRDHLVALGIPVNMVETGCPHDMDCMLALQGMNSAAFIAARLGSASVPGAPVIAQHPASTTACLGGGASFSAGASGAGPFTYQWQIQDASAPGGWADLGDGPVVLDGRPIGSVSGARTVGQVGSLIWSDADARTGVALRCVASTSCGTATSDPAVLSLCLADLDDGSAAGACDNAVDVSDLLFFLAAFEAGDLRVDLDDGSATGTPDDGVDVSDLLYFLLRFEAGC